MEELKELKPKGQRGTTSRWKYTAARAPSRPTVVPESIFGKQLEQNHNHTHTHTHTEEAVLYLGFKHSRPASDP